MKHQPDKHKFDFHGVGLAIKQAREARGMTQEELAAIIERVPRTIMYIENDGQHPSLDRFYQMVTMFDISVDQFFYPNMTVNDACRKRIDVLLNKLDEDDLPLVESLIQAVKDARKKEAE